MNLPAKQHCKETHSCAIYMFTCTCTRKKFPQCQNVTALQPQVFHLCPYMVTVSIKLWSPWTSATLYITNVSLHGNLQSQVSDMSVYMYVYYIAMQQVSIYIPNSTLADIKQISRYQIRWIQILLGLIPPNRDGRARLLRPTSLVRDIYTRYTDSSANTELNY